jgi:hypothetical protein
VGAQKNKGFGKPFQISPTPCKNSSKPTANHWVTIQEWICAQNQSKKRKKMRDFGEMGFREKWEK